MYIQIHTHKHTHIHTQTHVYVHEVTPTCTDKQGAVFTHTLTTHATQTNLLKHFCPPSLKKMDVVHCNRAQKNCTHSQRLITHTHTHTQRLIIHTYTLRGS